MTKPVLVFDGDCSFCRKWIARWKSITGNRIDYEPYQAVAVDYPGISEADFKRSIQFIEPPGPAREDLRISSGAEAVFRSLAYEPANRWMLRAYEHIPPFRAAAELFYRVVASNRVFFSHLTRLVWGDHLEPPTYAISRFVFMKILAVIYFAAFLSLSTQILPLVGSHGILPADQFFAMISEKLGPEVWQILPSLFWLKPDDAALNLLTQGGLVCSLFLFAGVLPHLMLVLLWLFYLSLVNTGQDFMAFQWDSLLLETGFLALFVASPVLWDRARPGSRDPNRLGVWLMKWLLFRLMFSSGMVKLASGDPIWRNFTALVYHYETQPLPTGAAWWMHQLPAGFQKISCLFMFGTELAIPFLFFLPGRIRVFAAFFQISLQLLIIATGNYCFFNLLALAMSLFLLDDVFWKSFPFLRISPVPPTIREGRSFAARSWTVPLGILILALSLAQLPRAFNIRSEKETWTRKLLRAAAPYRTVNSYGLFAVMTTNRPELVIEGSTDLRDWKPYGFRYKPGDVFRRPRFNLPHQPRLDWQMWFAALGQYEDNSWLLNFCAELLQGSPEALGLLERNPFPGNPPLAIRILAYEYRFTTVAERNKTRAWWKRELKGLYCPVLSLKKIAGEEAVPEEEKKIKNQV